MSEAKKTCTTIYPTTVLALKERTRCKHKRFFYSAFLLVEKKWREIQIYPLKFPSFIASIAKNNKKIILGFTRLKRSFNSAFLLVDKKWREIQNFPLKFPSFILSIAKMNQKWIKNAFLFWQEMAGNSNLPFKTQNCKNESWINILHFYWLTRNGGKFKFTLYNFSPLFPVLYCKNDFSAYSLLFSEHKHCRCVVNNCKTAVERKNNFKSVTLKVFCNNLYKMVQRAFPKVQPSSLVSLVQLHLWQWRFMQCIFEWVWQLLLCRYLSKTVWNGHELYIFEGYPDNIIQSKSQI